MLLCRLSVDYMRGEFKLPKAYVCEQVGDLNTHWAFVGGISLVKPFQRDHESHLSTAHTPSHSNPSQQEGQLTHTATEFSGFSEFSPPHTNSFTPKNTCTFCTSHHRWQPGRKTQRSCSDLVLIFISGDPITHGQLRRTAVHTWCFHVSLPTTCNRISSLACLSNLPKTMCCHFKSRSNNTSQFQNWIHSQNESGVVKAHSQI